MLEQEIASIIKFTLDAAGNPAPYYSEAKEDFVVPSCYFPPPEIDTDGETFSTYRLRYSWRIKFFHSKTEGAYAIAQRVLVALKGARNLVPLIGTDGEPTGEHLRLLDPAIKKVDSGAYQLVVEWDSRRPYNDPEYLLVQEFHIENWNAPEVYLEREISSQAISQVQQYIEANAGA